MVVIISASGLRWARFSGVFRFRAPLSSTGWVDQGNNVKWTAMNL